MVDSLKISHYDEGEFDVAAAAVVAVDDDVEDDLRLAPDNDFRFSFDDTEIHQTR